MRDTCGLPASRGRGHTAVQREMRNHLPNTTQKEPVWQPLRGYSRARSRERPGRAGHPTVQEQPMSGRVPPRPWVIPMCNTKAFEACTGGYPVRNFCWNSSMWYPSHAPPKEQASWLLCFARRRDHPMAWRVGDHKRASPSHTSSGRDHGIIMYPGRCWGILRKLCIDAAQQTMANVFSPRTNKASTSE